MRCQGTLSTVDPKSDGTFGNRRTARAVAMAAALCTTAAPAGAWAMAPPVEFALEAVSQQADERSEPSWAMTKVGEGLVELCGESGVDDAGAWRFSGDDVTVEVGPDAKQPWALVWTLLWATQPQERLAQFDQDWTAETARVEVVDDEIVYCYGEESRLCVDESLRRIVVVDVEIDGVNWGVRATSGAQRVQVSKEGSLVARFRAGRECES